MACLKGVWFQHFWPFTANNLIRSWSQCWSWWSLASETQILKSFVAGEEKRKSFSSWQSADPLKTKHLKANFKRVMSWELRRKSVFRVLNNRPPPPPTPSSPPFDVSHPSDLSKRLTHMICINRLLPYTSRCLIKASSGRLGSGTGPSGHQEGSGESYKTSTATLAEPPAFSRLAHCGLWNYRGKMCFDRK